MTGTALPGAVMSGHPGFYHRTPNNLLRPVGKKPPVWRHEKRLIHCKLLKTRKNGAHHPFQSAFDDPTRKYCYGEAD